MPALPLLAVLFAAPAPDSAAGPSTLLVAPFVVKGEGSAFTGVAVAEVVVDFIAQVNRDNFITLKQLDATLRPRNIKLHEPSVAEGALGFARALGATEFISGEITRKGDLVAIEAKRIRVRDQGVIRTVKQQGPRAVLPVLAKKLASELMSATTKAPPPSRDPEALEVTAECFTIMARQSLSPRAKGTLDAATVKIGEARCRDALKLDANAALTRAMVSVALTCRGEFDEARNEARRAQTGRFVAIAVLAEAFALRRGGDPKTARQILETAIGERPGFLQAIGYLGEEKLEVRDNVGAKVDFERYLKRAPGHAWAQSKLGHALARLGKKDEAIAITRKAVAQVPEDPELNIELGSRLIDAGKDDESIQYFKAAMDAKPPRALAGLRLGYLYLKKRRYADARELFNRVIAGAQRTDESRTRQVAQFDLALVAAHEDDFEETVQRLGAAREEGMRNVPCDNPAFKKWRRKAELKEICKEEEGKEPIGEDEAVSVDF